MPQNNQSITSSPEFKQFCKHNNLEVFNQEAVNVVLYNLSQENFKLREYIEKITVILNNMDELDSMRQQYPGIV